MERWISSTAVDLIEQQDVTISVGATPFLRELIDSAASRNARLPSLRIYACGGAPVPPELVYRAHDVMDQCVVSRIYGSTEAPTISLGVVNRAEQVLGATTDGHIVGHEVRVVDITTGQKTRPGEEGEITTRGPEVCRGYHDPQATSQSFTPEGFFRTGDLGKIVYGDCIEVTGRLKDLIIRGGENISPKEIEDVLHQHPAVREVAVVAMPSERMGETVCAFVIPNLGCNLTVQEAADFLTLRGLARQKFPEHVELVDEFPVTPSGKVRKDVLRSRMVVAIPHVLARRAR
jgi:acyl-CoA synthetase (AMP-forming)/AMP-acid ligase II